MQQLSSRFGLALALLLCASVDVARAEPCRSESFEGTAYTVCSFDPAQDDVRMFLRKGADAPYKTFEALAEALKEEGLHLAFAINGGMYGDDFSPTGLFVEEGRELSPINTKTVTGEPQDIPNFYKKPNGIFYLAGKTASVMTTDAWTAAQPEATFATQSGPMLVIDGKIHPAFIENSTDRKDRDGVGIDANGKVHFVITEDRVNFHGFARFFRDGLGCANALFLDGGSAPGIYAPELGRDDAPGHGGYGPIIGVVGQ
jgi:uncharacterized protein YigE (DUF2233 family)